MRAAAALLSLLLTSTHAPMAPAVSVGPVERVDCAHSRGSAFRIGPKLLLSVKHVMSASACKIGGTAARSWSAGYDFSIVEEDGPGPYLKVDCGGYVAGHTYVAIGFARGLNDITPVEVIATGQKQGDLSILWGIFTFIPGMSGGPVIDPDTGKVVGTVNTYDAEKGFSGSIELRGTPVCSKA